MSRCVSHKFPGRRLILCLPCRCSKQRNSTWRQARHRGRKARTTGEMLASLSQKLIHSHRGCPWRQPRTQFGQVSLWLFSSHPQKHQARAKSPSGGRVEVLRRGTSRMDAARGVMGQGWPMYAGPRSSAGGREVERSETRMQGACFFCLLFFARAKKSEAPEGAQHETSAHTVVCRTTM